MKDLRDRTLRTKKHKWPARVVDTTRSGTAFPVTAYVTMPNGTEVVMTYTKALKRFNGTCNEFDLEEVFPWTDLAIDAPVICWNESPGEVPAKMSYENFAGVSDSGYPLTFLDGRNSHTDRDGSRIAWTNCVSLEEWQLMMKENEECAN